MPHLNRSRSKANVGRRLHKRSLCELRHQQATPGYKRDAILKKYPHPPSYSDDRNWRRKSTSFSVSIRQMFFGGSRG